MKKTGRGFAIHTFTDHYGKRCSLQKSSLAFEDAIWLGINKVTPIVMASQAKSLGINTEQTTGWIDYPVPESVLLSSRMHLTQERVAELIPMLQHFVDTGELPEGGL